MILLTYLTFTLILLLMAAGMLLQMGIGILLSRLSFLGSQTIHGCLTGDLAWVKRKLTEYRHKQNVEELPSTPY